VISLHRGQSDPKFQVEGVTPTNHSSSQKTRLNDLSYGIKIWTDERIQLIKIITIITGSCINYKRCMTISNYNSRSSFCSLVGAASLINIRGCLLIDTRFVSLFDSENISNSTSQTHTQYSMCGLLLATFTRICFGKSPSVYTWKQTPCAWIKWVKIRQEFTWHTCSCKMNC